MIAVYDTLATACERALVASARAQRANTRQQCRAAARRFVRRHGHDAAYLRWVLHSVAASSALALALLGLGAEPAHAKTTAYTALNGAANPLEGRDIGLFSAPVLGDLDGDGDVDLVAGERLGGFAYFENTGSATSAAFVPRTGAANPFEGRDVGLFSTPALGDLDGDGDLDLVSGEDSGSFFYFENTGNADNPAFIARTGVANPFYGQSTGYASSPTLGDLDADGDLDLVAGEYSGTLLYFENTGSVGVAAFAPRTGAANPLAGQDLDYFSSPALGDVDADGDLDLIAGKVDGAFAYFENTGNATNPAFAALPDAASPLDHVDVEALSTPALGDLDGDADLDLVIGQPSGAFASSENHLGALVRRTGAGSPFEGTFKGYRNPALGDLDADGDLDLITGYYASRFQYLENTGTAQAPAFVDRFGAFGPLVAIAPTLGDLDGDGDLDILAGSLSEFRYFENTGSVTNAAFVQREGAANPLNGVSVSGARPGLGDLDADGDLDLVVGEYAGTFRCFENTGSATSAAFIARTGAANPLAGQDIGFWSAPALGDFDADGDLDLVSGEQTITLAALSYFENTGSASSPIFVRRTGAANPIAGPLVPDRLVPTFGDLDGDGDGDVVASTGVAFTGGSADLNHHSFYENAIMKPGPVLFVPEPGHAGMFAGMALLAWLDRLNARRRDR